MRAKVIIVVFDGCRPDALAQARTPAVDALWQAGAYTWTAQTVVPSWTLPTHSSMFRGVTPQQHGIHDNTFVPSASAFPSMFDVAHGAGLRTAMFYSWEELRDLSAHGSLDTSVLRSAYVTASFDAVIAAQAADHLIAEQPDLSMVYLCESDLVGHDHGWMSAPYIAAIERMDRALAALVQKLAQHGLRDQFTWLVLADHGGHEFSHGSDHPADTTIPWIISGPGIKRRHAIQAPVRIVDTAATVTHLLKIERPTCWEGQPVWDAFDA